MNTQDYLACIVRDIHTTVVATLDADGLPVTCAIDMMDYDARSLYFLTARGKDFYARLKRGGYLALTGTQGADTLQRVSVSVRGRVRELGPRLLPWLFAKNPYMHDIYPNAASRAALTVFQLYEGTGQWFDLSTSPVTRDTFAFGGATPKDARYAVTGACSGCGACARVCPQGCIDTATLPARIDARHCLCCGRCRVICPRQAICYTQGS
nr:pyridoxamine 5'-phosphate oxidase family protein [Maliibacterium massiliense]